jgi:hypothetical protein
MIINATIVPGESLGGIAVGSNVEDIISELSNSYSLVINKWAEPA